MISYFGKTNKSILIFGGGKQGLFLSQILSCYGFTVTVADKIKVTTPNKVEYLYLDISDVNDKYSKIFGAFIKKNFDLAICCLPGKFGFSIQRFCARNGIDLIDMSFGPVDPSQLNTLAQMNGCSIIPDIGLAPGLPSLIIGNWIMKNGGKPLEPVEICVGGITTNPDDNSLGYLETFSIEDLYHEYTRPARYVSNGMEMSISNPVEYVRNMLKTHELFGDTYESIPTDGVRTILSIKELVPDVIERTLRHPGHYEKILEILKKSNFYAEGFASFLREEIKNTSKENITDKVVFDITSGKFQTRFVVKGTKENTAMSITTAGAVAALVCAISNINSPRLDIIPNGVVNPEKLGNDRYLFNSFFEYYRMIINKYSAGMDIKTINGDEEK